MLPLLFPNQTSKPASAKMKPRLCSGRFVTKQAEEDINPWFNRTTGFPTSRGNFFPDIVMVILNYDFAKGCFCWSIYLWSSLCPPIYFSVCQTLWWFHLLLNVLDHLRILYYYTVRLKNMQNTLINSWWDSVQPKDITVICYWEMFFCGVPDGIMDRLSFSSTTELCHGKMEYRLSLTC